MSSIASASAVPRGRALVVAHGHIQVNGKNCNIPSLVVKKGDKIAVKNKPKSLAQVKLNQTAHTEPIPDFLEIVANEPPEGMVKSIPGRGDVDRAWAKTKNCKSNSSSNSARARVRRVGRATRDPPSWQYTKSHVGLPSWQQTNWRMVGDYESPAPTRRTKLTPSLEVPSCVSSGAVWSCRTV